MDESLHNEQVVARGLIEWDADKPACDRPIQFDGECRPRLSGSPALGEHNTEVLVRLARPAA